MLTIVEMPEFIRKAESVLGVNLKQEQIEYLAVTPDAGVLIADTGGIRKLRWMRKNTGNRSDARVDHYYRNKCMTWYLLTAFGKNEKDELSFVERKDLAK